MDVALLSTLSHRYGGIPYSTGLAGAINSLMNKVPYGVADSYQREYDKYSFNSGASTSRVVPISMDHSPDEMLVYVMTMSSEDIGANSMFDELLLDVKSGSYAPWANYDWYESASGLYVELHVWRIISKNVEPLTGVKPHEAMSIRYKLREGGSSNVLTFTSNQRYDTNYYNKIGYKEIFRYRKIELSNVQIPSMLLSYKQHWYAKSISYFDGNDQKNAYLVASVRYDDVIPSGENVKFTAIGRNGEKIVTLSYPGERQITFDYYELRSLGHNILSVSYEYWDGLATVSGTSITNIYVRLDSERYYTTSVFFDEKKRLDNITINALIETGLGMAEGYDRPHEPASNSYFPVIDVKPYIDRSRDFSGARLNESVVLPNFSFKNAPTFSDGEPIFAGLSMFKWFFTQVATDFYVS